MFEEKYPMDLKDTLPSDEVLKLCPWLWSRHQLWAHGICSETGSLHTLSVAMLKQKFDPHQYTHLIAYSWKRHSHQVHVDTPHDREGKNRREGDTIAERLIMMLYPDCWSEDLVVPTLVVEGSGPVDRSTHFYIYRHQNIGGNLMPMILEAANSFRPSYAPKSSPKAAC